jgi:PQQ enzyme repeat
MLGVVALLLVASCKSNHLQTLTNVLHFDPASLEFDPAFADGQPRLREVQVVNEGQAAIEVSWTGLTEPFTVELPTRLVPGANTLTVRWTPQEPGSTSQPLTVHFEGAMVTLTVEATANPIPTCMPQDPCTTSAFDRAQGKCVDTPLADGSTCDPGTQCVVGGHCITGRCVGKAKTCDDGNACTIDVCYPLTGCEFLPAPPCPGDGVCLEGFCDPRSGCGLRNRPDGATCGASTSCTQVSVCIGGACASRDPPDGYVCAEASPCRGEGRCVNDVCQVPSSVSTLEPRWSLDLAAGTDAGMAPQLQDFVLEESGRLSLSGFFNAPSILRADGPSPVEAPLGPSRRCILWNARYVCADYPASPNGRVSALDLTTGALLWTFDVRTARPDFVAVTSTIFLARLVVQGSDRLAAVFEAYPLNIPGDGVTLCRKYFLAVVNASGRLIQAQAISDPLLDSCNHPHPYGVASDSGGNVYLAFSPTVSNHAPLVPAATTLLMSYSRDGVFRWKRLNEGMRGGELAVARGLLYAEYSTVALDATSGQSRFSLPSELGRVAISAARLIPAPLEGATSLVGFEAGTSVQRWRATLPSGSTFWADQMRLAQWQTSKGKRTVALTWVREAGGAHALFAVDVQDGSTAFQCPVAVPARTPPQVFEIANGSMGMMNGAMDVAGNAGCSKCDPPLAGSAGHFFSFPTEGLSVADEPWVGAFGGAGHDHQEN